MEKKRLAIFDMDGTLFDTKDVNYYSYKRALEEEGYSMDYRFYCEFCNGRHYTEFLPRLIGNDKDALERIHSRKKRLYVECLNKARINMPLFDIICCLKKKYYCAIVTTASKKNCYDLLDFFQCRDTFELILTQEDIPLKKPDPQGFLMAMKYFGLKPEDTIIFEDSETGIRAAEASGADFYVVHGYN